MLQVTCLLNIRDLKCTLGCRLSVCGLSLRSSELQEYLVTSSYLAGKIVAASNIETHTDLYVKQSINLYKFMELRLCSIELYRTRQRNIEGRS
jgi:hypothetical protein